MVPKGRTAKKLIPPLLTLKIVIESINIVPYSAMGPDPVEGFHQHD